MVLIKETANVKKAFPANKRSAMTQELTVAERRGSLGDVAAERNSPFLFGQHFYSWPSAFSLCNLFDISAVKHGIVNPV